ncbi:hypothetical protein ASPBRDRAFT_42658 [Aspergillus brasiliensis CBS 101740]|uniref:Secreted protein n=1 Tax=Aspergillus brasiliensis (strain CBS 101740 / IMI 381727 / IBT 21946) TaxID=767769 RepID=A0A1L9UMK6_ASPBC|nr:hypothetical protein ASPBRDRAFT_42658 [Aspergillus brasiliensis CBS 101740]
MMQLLCVGVFLRFASTFVISATPKFELQSVEYVVDNGHCIEVGELKAAGAGNRVCSWPV